LFDDVIAHLGGLDILVNNAGISGPTALVEDVDYESWTRTLAVNLTGAFLCARHAVPLLKQAQGGSIVNMSSNSGLMGVPRRSPYVATKWALVGFTRTLAMELGPFGIRVNAVCPGNVEGDRIERCIAAEEATCGLSREDIISDWVQGTSLRCFQTADDIANTILFLCSGAGAAISGQAIAVDGHVDHV
jgi:NAD(P)-dependent dehydrogenase (short-subunit alcohol dehydrogenase family)